MDAETIIIFLCMENSQLIRLTFTKIYLCRQKTIEKGSNLDPAMFSGHGKAPLLRPCLIPRGLFISPIVNKHSKLSVRLLTRGIVTLRLSSDCFKKNSSVCQHNQE